MKILEIIHDFSGLRKSDSPVPSYLSTFPGKPSHTIMADEEHQEHEALMKEMESLKSKIQSEQGPFKDKSLEEVCSSLQTVGKLKLKTKHILRGHIHKINALDFAPNNRHLVTGSLDGKLIIWDTLSAEKEQIIPLKSCWILALNYAPGGQFLASGGMDNMVTVYDLKNCDADGTPKINRELGFSGFLTSCKFLNDTKLITGSGGPKITKWDLVKGVPMLELFGHAGDIPGMALNPQDENTLVTGSLDLTAKLWDFRMEGACQTFWGHESDVNCISFHPSGMAFTTASEDNTAKLYDIRSDQEVATYTVPSSEDLGLTSCVLTPSGRYLLCGHADSGIHAWDVLKNEHLGFLTGHEGRVTSLAISPNGIAVGSASWDQTARLWI